MLPEHHYSEKDSAVYNDSEWIEAQIDMLPISIHKKVINRYSEIYSQLTEAEDTKSRFRANTWLRSVVSKYKIKTTEGFF